MRSFVVDETAVRRMAARAAGSWRDGIESVDRRET
jgi:hypothetical protein